MKSNYKKAVSFRVLSLLTLLVVLVSGLGMTNIVNAAVKSPDISEVKDNTTACDNSYCLMAGDMLKISGKIKNVQPGRISIHVLLRKSTAKYNEYVIDVEDSISYVNGPTVYISEFESLNAELSRKSISAGTYYLDIIIVNKLPNGTENYASRFRIVDVISKSSKQYDFVYNHVGYQFGMSSSWKRSNTIQLSFSSNAKVSAIARDAIYSYLRSNPKCDAKTFVTKLYRALLYREPDQEGLAYWVRVINMGMSRQEVAQWWTSSYNTEFVKLVENKKLGKF